MTAKRVLTVCLFVLTALRLDAATLTVCASGCTYTQATLQTAINTAVDGDIITLKQGETFTGHWTLPDKNMTTGITIRTDTLANIPAAGVRVGLANVTAGMPTVQSDTTSDAAFKTAFGADHYTFIGIHFLPNPQGFGEILEIGHNACSVSNCQEFATQEPDTITVDRCYFEGDPVFGQKRGIGVNGKNITIINSYFKAMAGLGQDSQCVGGANGHGPLRFENNYCEASTESFMFGGDDPKIRTIMTVTGTPTTTSASVTVAAGSVTGAAHNLSELSVGQIVAIATSAGTIRRHAAIRSITGSGTSGSITFDAIPEVPDVPGDIRAGEIINGVTIKRNQFTKPLSWKNPIVGQPSGVTATSNTSAGTIAAGTYEYFVVALNKSGYNNATVYGNKMSVQATLAATGQIVLAWGAVSNASHYRVYGRAIGSVTQYWEVAAGTLTYTDTGSAGTAATSVPGASYWQIKNLGEVKAAQNVTISGNVFEYAWTGSDIGYSLWIKTNNANNVAEHVWSHDIVIENNIFRHIIGAILFSGVEYGSGNQIDAPMELTNVTVRNNLIYDSNSTWAVKNGGAAATGSYAFLLSNYPIPSGSPGSVNVQIYHNTVIHTSRGFITIAGKNHTGFVIRDNMGLRASNGINGSGAAEGNGALTTYATNATVTANALGGINTANYPAGNFGPSVPNWEAEFQNYSATGADTPAGPANFALRSDSTYITSATDGTPIGANIAAVLTATAGVATGAAPTANTPPVISTLALANGVVGNAYSQTLTASGTGALTWAVTAGAVPSGLTLSSAGLLSGVPTTAQTSTFTATVTDAGTSLTAAQSYTVVISVVYTAVTITTTTLPSAAVGQAYSATLARANGTAPFIWSLSAGTLPPGLTLSDTAGTITGTPTGAPGSSPITVAVADSHGTVATKALTVTVAQEAMPPGRPRNINQIIEAGTFLRPTAPPSAILRKGDLWIDTSTTPPTVRKADLLSPLTWGLLTGSHTILSETHTDTAPGALQPGDLMIVDPDGKLSRLPAAPGCLANDGTDFSYVPCSAATTGTTPTWSLSLHTRTNGTTTWVMPAALTEWNGSTGNRAPIDLSTFSQARLYLKIFANAAAGAWCRIEYSTDPATAQATATFTPLDGTSGPQVAVDVNAGHMLSSWQTIASAAKTDVFLRVACQGGNGATSVGFGNITVQLR